MGRAFQAKKTCTGCQDRAGQSSCRTLVPYGQSPGCVGTEAGNSREEEKAVGVECGTYDVLGAMQPHKGRGGKHRQDE